jgi:hypothetical protein
VPRLEADGRNKSPTAMRTKGANGARSHDLEGRASGQQPDHNDVLAVSESEEEETRTLRECRLTSSRDHVALRDWPSMALAQGLQGRREGSVALFDRRPC